ncbi:MAG TPA: hypothetical protein VKT73_11410 [Xanthobacteraceae bacterium]|nr:hypothetical protein [Xanthobacteraceae bacterium]
MDVRSLVSAFLAARIGEMQLAVAAKIAKTEPDSSEAVTKLTAAADQNMNELASVAEGLGGNVDIST